MGVRESLDQGEAQCTGHSGRYKGKHHSFHSHIAHHIVAFSLNLEM